MEEFSTLSGQTHALSEDPWKYLWAASRRAMLPFHELNSSLIAWRDPIGPEDTVLGLVEDFRSLASRLGKHAVLLAVSDATASRVGDCGFKSVWIGAEPFYALSSWNTRGKAGIKVRLACNHVKRLGAAAREADPLHDGRDREAVARVEELWKAVRPERRNNSFLRTAALENGVHRRYFVVETARGMESFIACSPVSRRGQYLQDVVRLPDAPRGANELAMLTAMQTFQAEGVEFVTGGIVPFFDPDREHSNGAGGKSRALRWIVSHFDHLFHFAGLQQFRAKFVPTRLVDVYALLWPGVLTPGLLWDIRSLLS